MIESDPDQPHDDALRVLIVSDNPETLDGLQEYLRRAGLAAQGSRRLEAELETPVAAVVVFPDDFETEPTTAVERLMRRHPSALAVIVTRDPRRFDKLGASSSAAAAKTLVIPKPAWAYTILDGIRGRSNA